jgi:hypothetical protein
VTPDPATDEATTPTDVWCLVLRCETGTVPTEIRVRHLLKYAKRALGLKCVAIPNDLPNGARTDQVLEQEP